MVMKLGMSWIREFLERFNEYQLFMEDPFPCNQLDNQCLMTPFQLTNIT